MRCYLYQKVNRRKNPEDALRVIIKKTSFFQIVGGAAVGLRLGCF